MQRLMVVSGDGHIGGSFEEYRPYIDPAYRDRIDDLAGEEAGNVLLAGVQRKSMRVPGIYEIGEEAPAIGGDVRRRLGVLDEQGIAAEILLVGTDHTQPFFGVTNRAYPADVRAAGVRAYHRWVADVVGDSDGRMFPVGYAGEINDLDEALAELQWTAEHGFVSSFIPGYVADSTRPPIYDKSFDRYWAACADLGQVIMVHVGWGLPQGAIAKFFDAVAVDGKPVDLDGFDLEAFGDMMLEMMNANNEDSPFALDLGPRQGLWQLMLSGVFDRHPSLRVVLTELRADWLPATLAYLDERFAKDAPHLELSPSEYFARNCAVTPTSPHRVEVAMRHEIGIDRFMFGADIPHPESTWPHTRQWIRDAFGGIPEDELRKILGENAVRFYNLDGAHLATVADRIGPSVDDVFGGPDIDERTIETMDARAGYLKPVEQIKVDKIAALLDKDFAQIGAK